MMAHLGPRDHDEVIGTETHGDLGPVAVEELDRRVLTVLGIELDDMLDRLDAGHHVRVRAAVVHRVRRCEACLVFVQDVVTGGPLMLGGGVLVAALLPDLAFLFIVRCD